VCVSSSSNGDGIGKTFKANPRRTRFQPPTRARKGGRVPTVSQAKVTVRKQVAIPKRVREKLGGLVDGDYLLFYEKGGEIYIKKGVITSKD